MTKLLYIGAGLDLNPLKHFPNTKNFVFVDTLPRSEFDSDTFIPVYFHKNFIEQLTSKIKLYGFEFEYSEQTDPKYFTSIMSIAQRIKWFGRVLETFPQINPTVMVFYNYKTSQELRYYMSTNILRNIKSKLLLDIESSTGLIVSGYHPDKLILELISRPISLYGYTGTVYNIKPEEQDSPDNMFVKLFKEPELTLKYFNNIYFVGEYGHINKCVDLFELDNLANLDRLDKIEESEEFEES